MSGSPIKTEHEDSHVHSTQSAKLHFADLSFALGARYKQSQPSAVNNEGFVFIWLGTKSNIDDMTMMKIKLQINTYG